MFKNKILKNASWIIICKIAQSGLGLIVSMLTARYLGPSNYGLINYAASIVAFVVPIMQLGLNNVIVQELVHNSKNEEGKIIGTSIGLSLMSSVLCIAGITAFCAIANKNEKETIIVCSLYSIMLIFQALELGQYWFQAKLLSKYTSIVSLVAYFIVSCYKIFLLVTHKSIYWFAISNSIDYMIIAISIICIYKKLGGNRLSFSFDTAKRMFSKSHYYIVSSLMVTIFAQTDRIMLKFMINNSATGYYSAAVTCAGITGFVFSAIIDSARPSIFESQKHSEKDFNKNMKRLYSVIIYISLLQSIVMTIFAPIIIHIMYGSDYSQSINALRIIVWYTTFSYIGSVRNIWMLAKNQQKYLWIINLSGAVANIVLNALLIPKLGINGASIASLITQFFTNVIVGYIIPNIRENNRLMAKSLNPKYLIEMSKKILNR